MIKKVINVGSLWEISEKDITDSIVYINIDSGCLIPEYIIAEVYNNNPFIRNKIVKNMNKINFNYVNKLIPTRHYLSNFIKYLEEKSKIIYYVTKNVNIEREELIKNLQEYNLPIKEIIHFDKLNNNVILDKIIYLDSKVEEINIKANIVKIFKLNIFN